MAEITDLLEIIPRRFFFYSQVLEFGRLNDGYSQNFKQAKICRKIILGKVPKIILRGAVLHWGITECISNSQYLYEYLKDRNLQVIENAHPSVLISAMNQLTENKLSELGLDHFVHIVLPSDHDSMLLNKFGQQCFLKVRRIDGKRKLTLHPITTFLNSYSESAFLVKRIKGW